MKKHGWIVALLAGMGVLHAAAAAQPDGYTLLVGNISTNSINPLLFASKMKVDAMRDLAGVTLLASIPNAIVASPKLPGNNWNGIFVPVRTPKAVIGKLFEAVIAEMKSAEMQDFLTKRLIPVALSQVAGRV